MKQDKTEAVIDRILGATPEQMEEIMVGIDIIMNGGSEADARAALVEMRKKRRYMTRLEEHRLLAGMTREVLAEKSGVDVDLIRALECDRTKTITIKVKDIKGLCAALGVIAYDLF